VSSVTKSHFRRLLSFMVRPVRVSGACDRKLKVVVPFTLLIIFVLLYLTFKRFDEALLIMATLPFALIGGIWLLYLLNYNLSVAGGIGFIALAGVSAEFGDHAAVPEACLGCTD
jgi:predicted RND superfamily exporter protein